MSDKRMNKEEAKKIIVEYLSQFQNYKSVKMIHDEAFAYKCSEDSVRKYTRELMLEGILERKTFIRRIENGVSKSGLIYGYRLIR